MTHQMVGSTVCTAHTTTDAHDGFGPSNMARTASGRSDLDDDNGLDDDAFEENDDDDLDDDGLEQDIEREDDEDGEAEPAGDGSAASESRVLGGIDDLGF